MMARPTKFKPEFVKVANSMRKLGATDVEIADAIGIDVRTFYRWSAENAAFCHASKAGRKEADDRVVRSLYTRATGYEHDEIDIRVVDKVLVKTKIRRYYPPDSTAAIFWLKNRQPEEWRDRQEFTGKDGGAISMAVAAVAIDMSKATPEQLRAIASLALPDGDAQ